MVVVRLVAASREPVSEGGQLASSKKLYTYIFHFCFQFSHDRKRKSCLFNFNQN